jgi:hypothetical protein
VLTYTIDEAAAICGVPRRRIQYFLYHKIFEPVEQGERGRSRTTRLGFNHIVALSYAQQVSELLDAEDLEYAALAFLARMSTDEMLASCKAGKRLLLLMPPLSRLVSLPDDDDQSETALIARARLDLAEHFDNCLFNAEQLQHERERDEKRAKGQNRS